MAERHKSTDVVRDEKKRALSKPAGKTRVEGDDTRDDNEEGEG